LTLNLKGILSAVVSFALNFARNFIGSGSTIYVKYMAIGDPLKAFLVTALGPVGLVVQWIPADWVLFGFSWLFLTGMLFLAVSVAKGFAGWTVAIVLLIIVVVYVLGPAFSLPQIHIPWPFTNSTATGA
jgi:hypothetical protein